jgi:2-keto-3-deoxy-L-fuconate dehydrogenase
MFKLNNKVALVTGGASGIGLAISKTFAEQGAYVHILEINEAEAQSAAQDIRNNGGNAEAHFLDVSKQNEVNTLVKSITDRHRIDILVNNAGISHIGKVHTTTEDDFDRLLTVNVKGPYNMLHAVIPHFLEQGGGVILNMASIAATVGLADRFAYSTTKGAVYTMTISVARDYINDNIRCNSISPARVHTPFVDGYLAKNYPGREAEMFQQLSATQPIGRMAKPEEIGALALYLCSDEAAFITGSNYLIDAGFSNLKV